MRRNDMKTQEENNTDQPILDFIRAMSQIVEKIKGDTAVVSDYENFEVMIKALGAPPEILKDILSKNGFSSWSEYYEERKKNENDRNIYGVKSIEGAISGILSAAVSTLNNILKRDNHTRREKASV